jgi:hypothetical protein
VELTLKCKITLKENKMKKISLLLIINVFLLAVAHAKNLEIRNNTNQYLTFDVNNVCSTEAWGVFGLAHPYSKNKIPEKLFKRSCGAAKDHCQLVVYAANKCSGTIVAHVAMDTDVGVKDITMIPDVGIVTAGHGFRLVFNGSKMQ